MSTEYVIPILVRMRVMLCANVSFTCMVLPVSRAFLTMDSNSLESIQDCSNICELN